MDTTQRVRIAGWCGIVGGALWFLRVSVTRAAFPQLSTPGTTVFAVSWAFATCILALILVGFLGIAWGGALEGWFGKIAFGVALLGYAMMVVGGVLTSLGIGPLNEPSQGVSLIYLLGRLIAALLTLLAGIAVVVARRWHGWTRWAPLLFGLWPILTELSFVILTPNRPPALLNAAWGLFAALLGFATLAQTRTRRANAAVAVG